MAANRILLLTQALPKIKSSIRSAIESGMIASVLLRAPGAPAGAPAAPAGAPAAPVAANQGAPAAPVVANQGFGRGNQVLGRGNQVFGLGNQGFGLGNQGFGRLEFTRGRHDMGLIGRNILDNICLGYEAGGSGGGGGSNGGGGGGGDDDADEEEEEGGEDEERRGRLFVGFVNALIDAVLDAVLSELEKIFGFDSLCFYLLFYFTHIIIIIMFILFGKP